MDENDENITDSTYPIMGLVHMTDHKTLVLWAADCAERVLYQFEQQYPNDSRPREAIQAARSWVDGAATVTAARKAAHASHAAAHDADATLPSSLAARAAGHASATAHVAGHAIHAANYAVSAIRAAGAPGTDAARQERTWQHGRLLELRTP